MQPKKPALTFLWPPNTDSHSDYRYRSHHSYSPSCCFRLVFCHNCKGILPLARSLPNKILSQDLDHGWECIFCSSTSDLKNPVVNSQHPIPDFFFFLLPNHDTLSERLRAYTWCTPWGSFLSISLPIFLEISTKVSQWENWQQSTPPEKTLICSSLSQSCWLSLVYPLKAPYAVTSPFLQGLLLSAALCKEGI